MNLVKGQAEVLPKPGKSFDPARIPKAIKDAGFTATEVEVIADGTLAGKNGALELDVPDLAHPFLLSGGQKSDALSKRGDLIGNRVRISGKLGQATGPASLTVEDFQAIPQP